MKSNLLIFFFYGLYILSPVLRNFLSTPKRRYFKHNISSNFKLNITHPCWPLIHQDFTLTILCRDASDWPHSWAHHSLILRIIHHAKPNTAFNMQPLKFLKLQDYLCMIKTYKMSSKSKGFSRTLLR